MTGPAAPDRPQGWLVARRDEARLAFLLLTRLPMGRLVDAPAMGRTVWAYPLAGAAVGGIAAAVGALALTAGLPPLAAALLALAAGVVASGALHEDGLADTADGFGGGADRARKLEIMKDSRIGSYGVVALVLALGLRAALLAGFAVPGALALALVLAGAGSRALLPALMWLVPPARAAGLGGAAAAGLGRGPVLVAAVLGLGPLLLLGPGGWLLVAALALGLAGLAALARRQIGGITGDVLGAGQVLAEVVLLAGLLLLLVP